MRKAIIAVLLGLAIMAFLPATAVAADNQIKVALILDQRRGDQGVIDQAVAGYRKRQTKSRVYRCRSLKPMMHLSIPTRFGQWRGSGERTSSLLFSRGLVKPALQSAKENPKVKYALIFAEAADLPSNVLALKYKDSQAYYISGVMAAMRTNTGKIAFNSGLDIPDGREAYNAYVKGATSVKPEIQTLFSVVGSFQDPAKGKEVTKSLISQGYDVFCGWASKSDWGAAEAAQEAGNAYVDGLSGVVDLRPKYGKVIIGQAGVDFGISAYQLIANLSKGLWDGGKVLTRTIATGDIGLQWVPTEADGYTRDQIQKILKVQEDFRTGKLTLQ